MDNRIKITRQGTEHYLECFRCGVPKTTRTQRRKQLCRSCSDFNRRANNRDDKIRTCIKCHQEFSNTSDFFHWKDKAAGRLDTTCKKCDQVRRVKWAKDNPEREAEMRRQEFLRNEPRRLKDPAYRMKRRVSSCIANTMARWSCSKDHPTWQALPYTPEQLKEHLEAQFDEHMTWDNYGDYWHIDHIYPQSLLPYDSLEHENFIKCWSLDNLQPLEAIENIRKSNNIVEADE